MVSIEWLYQKYLMAQSVTTDTRHLTPGALFFAIRGPHFNGNAFAAEALAKGARYVVIDDPTYATPPSDGMRPLSQPICDAQSLGATQARTAAYSGVCEEPRPAPKWLSEIEFQKRAILVKDSLATLIQLAGYHRSQYDFPVIAITGSYGKTTTKELTHAVLRTTYQTVATKGNLNTAIGVALTLLSIRADSQIAVIEMGATQLGDIALCCRIARPTHGLITAIGAAHLEGFGNIAGVIAGKSELYDYLYATGGTIFFNPLDPLLATLSKRFKQPIAYDLAPIQSVTETPYLGYQSSEGKRFTTHLLGKPHIHNIAAALCVAQYFNVPSSAAHQAIQDYIPMHQRMQLVVKGSNQLIIDSYNSSPASVQAALDALLSLQVHYRVVILGDMAELGQECAVWHHKIVEQLDQPCYDCILLCGPFFTLAAQKRSSAHPKFHCFPDKAALASYLGKHTFQNSGILLKAAHSTAIHTLVEALE